MDKFLLWIKNNLLLRISNFMLIVGILLIIVMMIIPMPAVLLDLFMTVNLLFSIVIILNILYIKSPLEFSSFPSLLLLSTVFSLALNISSTRLILSQGAQFGGRIVRAFGTFVVGTQNVEGLVIGPIIFIIIMVVQFIVITRGSSRVAEVSARFTLDSMPGKQMAIEAEFNSGAISEAELIQKRKEIQKEADFYGSMDGASKFISGNIIAGFIITFINIAGGLIIGVLIRGENVTMALTNYIQLTIGDGLVSQFPTLLISTASGIIVTKAAAADSISDEIRKEFTRYTRLYYLAGGMLAFFAFLPGFPIYIFLPLAALLIVGAYLSKSRTPAEEQAKASAEQAEGTQAERVEQPRLEPLDPITLEIGYDLVPLVQDDNGQAELLNRISSIRREVGVKMGLVIPLMRIVDNYLLSPDEYSIKFSGVEVAKAKIRINKLLAIQTSKVTQGEDEEPIGEETRDPAFGLMAYWIDADQKLEVEKRGYTVADPTAVISTHIATVIEANSAELLSRQDCSDMLDSFKEKYPAIVSDVTQHLTVGQIQRVLQRLLVERVSIRNLRSILETLGDYGALTKDLDFLVEKARQSLSRQISAQYVTDENTLQIYTLSPRIEEALIQAQKNGDGRGTMLNPTMRNEIIKAISLAFHQGTEGSQQFNGRRNGMGKTPVLVTSEMARNIVYRLLAMSLNSKQYAIPILSTLELADTYPVHSQGTIHLQEEHVHE